VELRTFPAGSGQRRDIGGPRGHGIYLLKVLAGDAKPFIIIQAVSSFKFGVSRDNVALGRHKERSMSKPDRSRVIRFAEAQAGIPGPAGERAVIALQSGTLDVALSLPLRTSPQTPHAQDEIYFIIRGRGVLFHDSKRDPFESGDLLFVAAGTEHHFEDITEDFALWRVFYGPHGGDVPA
jgi:mannose-6-phosphate isomerase-like protein (cupin superfamily)